MVGGRDEVFHSGGPVARAYAFSAYALTAEHDRVGAHVGRAHRLHQPQCACRLVTLAARGDRGAGKRLWVVHAAADTSDVTSSGSSPPVPSDSRTP